MDKLSLSLPGFVARSQANIQLKDDVLLSATSDHLDHVVPVSVSAVPKLSEITSAAKLT